jgi:two-component system heavy metal sensor histidine kinase CusS
MFLDRLRGQFKTLRFRLMAWNAAVVLLTAVATLVGLREGVRYTLIHEMDELLLEDVKEIRLAIRELNYPQSNELYEELDRKARGHMHHGWFVRLMDEGGNELWSSPNAPLQLSMQIPVGDLTPISFGGYRVVQSRPTDARPPAVTVRVGSSLELLSADMSRIDRLVAAAAGVVLLVAPLVGYWLAGRATRPLAQIISTTERLRPTKLDERLPLRHSGDELDQLSHTVNRLLDRIGLYLEEKRDFLANAAHELRTPLAAIRSSIEVALNSNRTLEEYEELLNELIDESSTLEVLVNQLLLLAETDADRLKIHNDLVVLDSIVARSVEMFQGVAEFRGIELRSSPMPPAAVEGNRHHLRQVLNNLLDNAIKFTPRGGRIFVSLQADDESRQVVLQVKDSGVGIAADDLPHVFERFYRGDKSRIRDAESRGTGLGLSICQAVIQSHGGQIAATSTPGQGTTMTVTLPIKEAVS